MKNKTQLESWQKDRGGYLSVYLSACLMVWTFLNAGLILLLIGLGLDDEIKVTVIATGLVDPTRERRRIKSESALVSNVTPLRPPDRSEIESSTDLTEATFSTAVEPNASEELLSPFDDEYDVPAFIRRSTRGPSSEQVS